jgi:hypothetical protein
MKTQLLVEDMLPDQSGFITESATDGKDMYISGIFMESGVKNRNGRIYQLEEMTNAVKQVQENIKNNQIFWGELDHSNSLQISSDRVSHMVTELRMEGNKVFGKAKILDTPCGKIAKVLIKESGSRMGVSSRGSGSVDESGVVSNFSLISVDIVLNPSCASAVPTAIYESLEASIKGRHILTLAEQIQEDASAQKYLVTELKQWMNSFLKK